MKQKYTDVRSLLESVEEGKSQVARLRRSVGYLQDKCTTATGRYGERASSGGQGPEDLWMKLTDRKAQLMEQEQQVQKQEQQVEQWIEQLPRPRWRMVMRCHYLDGMPLSEIAEELTTATGREFSVHQIYRLHRAALDAAEKLWPKN